MDKDGRDRTEYYRQRQDKRRVEAKALIRELKDVPCSDCGQRFDPVCMDFHHERDKEALISRLVSRGRTTEAILREVAKCVVLCANCHRLRHKSEGG